MMKRLVLALLVCGMGAVSFGQLLPTFSKLVVLKGTVTDSVHYVLNDAVPDTAAALAQRTALGIDALAVSVKPKVNYFLVVELEFTPQFAAGKATGEGDIWAWTMGAVEYGTGRHDANGVWQPKALYAYDIGGAVDIGNYTWWGPKAKVRAGDGSLYSTNAAETFADQKDGSAELVFSSKLMTNKTTGQSWYEPSITSLTITYTQMLQQLVGSGAGTWKDAQFGAGKVVFKPDAKMTTTANQTNSTTGANTGLALVATAIHDLLVKGGYPAVTPDLDPFNYYP